MVILCIGNTMSNVEFVEYEFVETLKIPVLSLSCIHCHYRAIDSTIKYKWMDKNIYTYNAQYMFLN